MKSTIRGFRSLALGLCVAAGALAAPAAFARSHVSVGVSVPGVSVGYHSGWHGHNNYYVGVGGGYYGPRTTARLLRLCTVRTIPGAGVLRPSVRRSCYARSFYDARGYYHPGYYYSC